MQSEFFSSECVHSAHFLPQFNWLPINVKESHIFKACVDTLICRLADN